MKIQLLLVLGLILASCSNDIKEVEEVKKDPVDKSVTSIANSEARALSDSKLGF